MDSTDLDKAAAVLTIDEGALDQECLKHPRRVFRWLQLEADAKQEVSLAKARLDLAKTRTRRLARLDPAAFKLKDKPTVDDLAEAVAIDKEVIKAQEELTEAEHHADQVKGVVSALHEKRRALERLVELKQIDYYAEPRPKVGNGAMHEGTKRAARGPVKPKEERDD